MVMQPDINKNIVHMHTCITHSHAVNLQVLWLFSLSSKHVNRNYQSIKLTLNMYEHTIIIADLKQTFYWFLLIQVNVQCAKIYDHSIMYWQCVLLLLRSTQLLTNLSNQFNAIRLNSLKLSNAPQHCI